MTELRYEEFIKLPTLGFKVDRILTEFRWGWAPTDGAFMLSSPLGYGILVLGAFYRDPTVEAPKDRHVLRNSFVINQIFSLGTRDHRYDERSRHDYATAYMLDLSELKENSPISNSPTCEYHQWATLTVGSKIEDGYYTGEMACTWDEMCAAICLVIEEAFREKWNKYYDEKEAKQNG